MLGEWDQSNLHECHEREKISQALIVHKSFVKCNVYREKGYHQLMVIKFQSFNLQKALFYCYINFLKLVKFMLFF